MNDASGIAEQIGRRLGNIKTGTLRLWGEWFGRPYDNIHTITDASAEGEVLAIGFDQGESLFVWRPDNVVISRSAFTIQAATRVRWEWNYYGRPQGRRYFYEYVRKADQIEATTDVDWDIPVLKPSGDKPAVEIL